MVAELGLNSVNPPPDTIEEVRDNPVANDNGQSLSHIIQQTCGDSEGPPKGPDAKKGSSEFKTR